MKIVLISDTHGRHERLKLPEGDMIIHAGDVGMRGNKQESLDFMNWFSSLDYTYKVFIAGNHDFYFEKTSSDELKKLIPENVMYLNDSGVTIEGLKLWGSPVQPWFFDWAFNRYRGAEIKRHWDLIPQDTDILITHGPAHGVLDKVVRGPRVGCEELIKRIQTVKPELFVFGHIHEAYGQYKIQKTLFVNASVLDERYQLVNQPVVVEVGGEGNFF